MSVSFNDPMALLAAEIRLSLEIYKAEERVRETDLAVLHADYNRECALYFAAGGLKPHPGPHVTDPTVPGELLAALDGIRTRRREVFADNKADAVAMAQKKLEAAQKRLEAHRAKLQPLLEELERLDGCPFTSRYDAELNEAYALIRSGIAVSRPLDVSLPVTNRLVEAVEAAEQTLRGTEAKPFPDAGGFSGELHADALDGVERAWRERFAERPDLFGPTLLDALRWQRETLAKIQPMIDRGASEPHATQPGWRFDVAYHAGKITGGNLSRYDRSPRHPATAA